MSKTNLSRTSKPAMKLFAAVLSLAMLSGCETIDTEEDDAQGKDTPAGSSGRT